MEIEVPKEAELLEAALAVLDHAHAPYSGYAVGAALLDAEGRIHVGCNVENASFGLTICAERSALSSAVARGARRFQGVVIAFGQDPVVPPCGACRQFLAEFGPDLPVAWGNGAGIQGRALLSTLLPGAFEGDFLQRKVSREGGPGGSQADAAPPPPAGHRGDA